MTIDYLRPTQKRRVIDLVREAGIDVGDWANSSVKGEAGASANPKYCYEWAFSDASVVVLNLWHGDLIEEDGMIFQRGNLRADAEHHAKNNGKAAWIARARGFDQAVAHAYSGNLPIRVIINDGQRRRPLDVNAKASRVNRRDLDKATWSAKSYDASTGGYDIVRLPPTLRFIDQFIVYPGSSTPQESVSREVKVYPRDPTVRAYVLARANGSCERCGVAGFLMTNGAIYLETHHVIPLAEGGLDHVSNVIALCPNDHRRAHHGNDHGEIRVELLDRLRALGV